MTKKLETVKQIGGPEIQGYLEDAEIVGVHWGKTLQTTENILGIAGVTRQVTIIWSATLQHFLSIDGGKTRPVQVWFVQHSVRDTNEDLSQEDVPHAYWIHVPNNIIAMDELAILANKAPYGEHDWILRYMWPVIVTEHQDTIFRLDNDRGHTVLEVFNYHNGRTVVSIDNFRMTGNLAMAGLRYLGEVLRKTYEGPQPRD